jgi:hypothetical protein
MEIIAHGQGITAAEAKSACERVEYEAESALRSATLNFETMASDLRKVADVAVAENNQFRAEFRANSLEIYTFRAELADQRQQSTAHANQTAAAEMAMSKQKERWSVMRLTLDVCPRKSPK